MDIQLVNKHFTVRVHSVEKEVAVVINDVSYGVVTLAEGQKDFDLSNNLAGNESYVVLVFANDHAGNNGEIDYSLWTKKDDGTGNLVEAPITHVGNDDYPNGFRETDSIPGAEGQGIFRIRAFHLYY